MSPKLAAAVLVWSVSGCVCQPAPTTCQIGDTIYPEGTPNPASRCQVCSPAENTTGWSNAEDPRSCVDAGRPPDAGGADARDASVAGCLIGGQFFPNRTYMPGNTGVCCNATKNPTGWSAALVKGSSVPTGTNAAQPMRAVDLNGDGLTDVVIASGSLILLINQGQETFSAVAVPTVKGFESIELGDFNRDGRLDFALGAGDGVGVVLNLDAGFTESDRSAVGNFGRVAVGDFNGDGNLDLVGAGQTDWVSVFFGDGLGGLGPEHRYPVGGTKSWFVGVGLFDPDPLPDLVVTDVGQGAALLRNDGTGGFSNPIPIPGIRSSYGLIVGHFEAPALWDVAIGSQLDPQTTVFSKPAAADFANGAGYSTVYSGDYAICDLNGDGHDDLVAMGEGQLDILINRGDGTFFPASAFVVSTTVGLSSLTAGDFDGDGAPDIMVVPTGASAAEIWLNGCP